MGFRSSAFALCHKIPYRKIMHYPHASMVAAISKHVRVCSYPFFNARLASTSTASPLQDICSYLCHAALKPIADNCTSMHSFRTSFRLTPSITIVSVINESRNFVSHTSRSLTTPCAHLFIVSPASRIVLESQEPQLTIRSRSYNS